MTSADDPKARETFAATSLPFGIDYRYRLLIDSIEDHAIYMLDADGRVASWNRGAERIFGYTADEIMGRDFACFFPAADRVAGVPGQFLARAAEAGNLSVEAARMRKSGERFWAQISLQAMREGDTLLGFSAVLQDTTERRLIEAQRQMS